MKENPLREKSYAFALSTIQLCIELTEKKEYVLSKQLLRAGTSIGANIAEALQAQSKKDFVAKLSIALKEANETYYWLRLLRDSNYLEPTHAKSFLEDIEELLRLLTSIMKTSRANMESMCTM